MTRTRLNRTVFRRTELHKTALLSVVVSATLLLAGCSTMAPKSSKKQELAELKQRVIELQRKAAVNEVELARLRQQLAEGGASPRGRRAAVQPRATQTAQTTQTAPRSRPPASVGSTRVENPVISGGGSIEQTDLAGGEATDVPVARRIELDQSSSPVATSPAPRAHEQQTPPPTYESHTYSSSPPETTSAPARRVEMGPAPNAPLPAAAQSLYDRGYTQYHQGRYVDAEESFRQFSESYPASDLADNAQYWIGECRYSRQDFRGALAAFQETVNRHPTGNKIPDALLKTGQVLEKLGDSATAKERYREIQRRFPDTAAAVVASERLRRL